MCVTSTRPRAHATDNDDQTAKEIERHFPERPRPIRIENAHFDVRQRAECGEKIPCHAAHAAATFGTARRYVDHPDRLARRPRHD